MKILHACHLYPPAMGGIEHHVYQLSKELAKSGHSVEVFTSKFGTSTNNEVSGGVFVRRFFSITAPFFSSLRFSPSMFLALLKSDADVFCSHGYGSPVPLFVSIAALLKGKPFIFTLHGYPKLKGFGKLLQLFYRFFFASIYLRIAKKVIIVSKISEKDILGEVDQSKIVYVPNGIDTSNYTQSPLPKDRTISYVGRLDKYKGIDVLVRSFAKLRKKYSDLKLSIVGKDEDMKAELVSLTSSLSISDSISFSQVPYSEVQNVYHSSFAIVLPSLYEGFPLIWLEAVASGRPMFSTKVGDYQYFYSTVYGSSIDLFLFESEDDLVKKLSAFLDNPKKFEPILASARERLLREFSWSKVTKDTIEVYTDALSK